MKYEQTVAAVNQVLQEYDMALTLRQIYYRLVAASLIPNRRSAYNGLSSQLVTARENGEVNDARIVDRSRRIDDFSFDSPEDFLAACRSALKNRWLMRMWASQASYVEVWVEKDALSAVLANAVRPLNTIVAPSRGYSSYSYVRDAASRIKRYCENGQQAIILHFADHDPSGLDMTRDLADRLNRYCSVEVTLKRIALTFDQVSEHNLVPNPTKVADPRSPSYESQYGVGCWELDALEPNELVRLAQSAVESEIDDLGAWEEVKERDQKARDKLEPKLQALEGDSDE